MLHLLRRCRALALTLVLASPGLGGTWLSLVHPCPVDMPWLAAEGHLSHGAQAAHGHGDAPAGSSSSCSCVGACQGGSVTLTSISSGPVVAVAAGGWDASPATANVDAPIPSCSH